jgi:hypothetical protein
MRKALAGALVVVALAFALAGCGDSGSSTNTNGSTAPQHASNGEETKSANQVLADAVKAAKAATFMRMNGNVVSSGQKIGLNFLISNNGDGSKGILYLGGQAIGLILIGKDGYLKAPTAFWTQFGGANGAAIAHQLNGKWLKFPADNAQFASLVAFSSPKALFDQLKLGADSNLKNNGTTTFNNQAVVALDDGENGTLYVAASGIPYPVALDKKGKEGGTVYFGAWNHPFPVTAPADAVDISQLPG